MLNENSRVFDYSDQLGHQNGTSRKPSSILQTTGRASGEEAQQIDFEGARRNGERVVSNRSCPILLLVSQQFEKAKKCKRR